MMMEPDAFRRLVFSIMESEQKCHDDGESLVSGQSFLSLSYLVGFEAHPLCGVPGFALTGSSQDVLSHG